MLTEFAMIAATAGLQEAAKKAVNGLLEFYKKNDYYFEDGETESILKEYMENAYQKNAVMNTIAFRGEGRTIFDLYYPLSIYRHSDYSTSTLFGKFTSGMTSFLSTYLLHNSIDLDTILSIALQRKRNIDGTDLAIIEYLCKSPETIEDLTNYIHDNEGDEAYKYLMEAIESNIYLIDEDFIDKLDSLDNIMIIDNAGMGKSTLAKYMSILAISNKKYIPFIIELRKLRSNYSIRDELFSQLDMYTRHLEISSIKEQLRSGGFLIIFDGFDEVTDDNKEQVIIWIKDFVSKAAKNKYVLTSRQEKAINAFGEFKEFAIQPLKEADAFNMILKFGNNSECSKQLIQCIREDKMDSPTFREFLGNPLMVSLLYRTYQYKNDLPKKKNEFYAQVYDALFCDHDKTKDGFIRPKKSGLSKDEFENVLRWVGWLSFQNEQIEFEYNTLVDIVQEAIDNAERVSCKAEDFIYDITHTVPLFEYIGTSIKWCHKSFMEYFSARCLYKDADGREKEEIVKELFDSSDSIKENLNIITFFVGMDYKTCRDCVYIPFLENMLNLVDTSEFWEDFYTYFSQTKIEESHSMDLWNSIMLTGMTSWSGNTILADFIHSNLSGFYTLLQAGIDASHKNVYTYLNADALKIGIRHNPFTSLIDILGNENDSATLSIMDIQSYKDVLGQLKKERDKKRNFSIKKK